VKYEVPYSGLYSQRNGVVELSKGIRENVDPFTDVTFVGHFKSPSGKRFNINGFYYGYNEWRVRFVPREEGTWQYRSVISWQNGKAESVGTFVVEGIAGPGFLRVSNKNPYRYEYEDATPFYPVGIQTCNFLQPDFDGPDENGKWRTTDTANWLKEFNGAINLVRTQFGQGTTAGCAMPLIPVGGDGSSYDLELAKKLDDTYQQHRAAGMAQILIFMQDMSLWGAGKAHAFGNGRDLVNYKNARAPNMRLQEQYLRYIVARYGCYIDIWEIFNEDSYAPPDYLAHLAKVIREADPYDHLLTTNYARPSADWCDISTFHEYMGMPANEVDPYLTSQFALYKLHGKLVQNTEFGNQGKLSNVDPVKWRIAVWTAFMNEGHLLFWGQSGNVWVPAPKKSGNANAYIGPDSRQHFRVHNQFVKDLPIDLRPAFTGYTGHTELRTYGLGNETTAIVYVHHFSDHSKPYKLPHKLMVHLVRGTWKIQWIDPATGNEVFAEQVDSPHDFVEITVPEVTIDLAARMQKVE
jgi:hypothetical protein